MRALILPAAALVLAGAVVLVGGRMVEARCMDPVAIDEPDTDAIAAAGERGSTMRRRRCRRPQKTAAAELRCESQPVPRRCRPGSGRVAVLAAGSRRGIQPSPPNLAASRLVAPTVVAPPDLAPPNCNGKRRASR